MTPVLTVVKNIFPASCHDRIVLVGGTVRDMLLGKESKDIDLSCALSPDDLLALGFQLVEASSGSNIFFCYHPDFGKIEVTCIENMAALRDDLICRDFTINAIAMDLSGVIFDHLGGKDDLAAGLLRPCSEQSFLNDPLRIFRAFRFECNGWRMTPEADVLIRSRNWSEAFLAMPIERFSSEMLKTLSGNSPEIFFQRIIDFNIGLEFLPELFRMPMIPAGPLEHHPEGDLFTHSVQVLQRVAATSKNPLARFCAFFHDIGKLATPPSLFPKHHGHDNAGFTMAELFCTRLCLPATHRKALAWISRLHGIANKWEELRDSTKVRMAEQSVKAGIVEILPLVSAADKAGNPPMKGWADAVQVAMMNTQELGIDQEKLEAMQIKKRTDFIMQKRVDVLRMKRAEL